MKLAILAVLPLVALAALQYEVKKAGWPVYQGAVPIRDPTNLTHHAPTSYDRALHWWLSLARMHFDPFVNYNLNNLYNNTFKVATKGSVSIYPSRNFGFNTLNAARYHALERYVSCPTAMSMTNRVMDKLSTTRLSCDATVTDDVRHSWFVNLTDAEILPEESLNRYNGAFGVHSLAASRIAAADMVCMGAWDPTTKLLVCPDDDASKASRGESLFMTSSTSVEMSTALYTDLSTSLQNYSISVLVTTAADPQTPSTYISPDGVSYITSVSHSVDKDGYLIFVAAGYLVDDNDVVTLFFENDTTGTAMPAAIQTASVTTFSFKMVKSTIKVSDASSASLDCIAYRVRLYSPTQSSLLWFPGGTSAKQGWLKTQGLGICKQNYCPCLTSEAFAADATITASCCEENCYISTNKSRVCRENTCVITQTCDGVSDKCPAITYAGTAVTCGYVGTGAECDISDTCNGAGGCTSNAAKRADGYACGSQTSTTCNGPDKCLNKQCNPNYASNTTSCGNTVQTDCHDPDVCDGFGNCPVNNKPAGTGCGTHKVDPGTYDCWMKGTCGNATPTTVSTCTANYRPSGYPCNSSVIPGACALSSKCTGTSETCVLHYVYDDGTPAPTTPCNLSTSSCIASTYCLLKNAQCPPLQPCLNCAASTNSKDCAAVPSTATFNGCKWCGEWGCQNRTKAKANPDDDECKVKTYCGAEVSHDYNKITPYADTPASSCSPWGTSTSSLEVVTLVDVDRNLVDHLCLLIDVIGDSAWSVVSSSTFEIRATFYNATASGPLMRIAETGWQTFTASDRGLKQLNISIYPTFLWGIVDTAYVGIEYQNECPGFNVVGFYDTVLPKDISLYDNANTTGYNWNTWTNTETSSTIQVYINNGTCGDFFVAQNEQCDKGLTPDWTYFCNGCQCGEFSVPDLTTGGCKCSYPLNLTYAHNFSAPPFMWNLTYDTTVAEGSRVSFWIDLPQTHSSNKGAKDFRWNATAWLVNARTGEDLYEPADFPAEAYDAEWAKRVVEWDEIGMLPFACFWRGHKHFGVAELIKFGQPLVYVHDVYADYYAIQFAVEVEWWEQVYLERRQVPPMPASMVQDRVMDARLTFEILVARDVDVDSTITVIDSKVLWAYIKRGFLVIPENSDPYFEVMMETRPVTDGLVIESNTFHWVNPSDPNNKIKSVTNLTQVGQTVDRFQSWNFTVYFTIWSMCNLSHADSFILTYTLIGQNSTVGISPSPQNMTFYLTTTENWCSDHIVVSLVPRQQLFATKELLVDLSASPSTKFLRGSVVYVRIDLSKDFGMPVSDITLQDATVYGSAMIDTKFASKTLQLVLYNVSESPAYFDPAWGPLSLIDCDVLVNGTMKQQCCYSVYITPDETVESKTGATAMLTIESLIEVSFATNIALPAKRAAMPTSELHSASSPLFLASAEYVQPAEQQQAGEQTVVVYRVTPGFLAAIGSLACISVLSIVSTVYFIRRRESAQQL